MAHIMLTFGSGGHSSEMLMLIENARIIQKLNSHKVDRVTCMISHDDHLIEKKLNLISNKVKDKDSIEIQKVKRGRAVGQSYLSSIWTIMISLLQAISIVASHSPNFLITNGPAISVVFVFAIRALQIITMNYRFQCRVLYVESFCRTKTLSLSGKLLYHLRMTDEFFVQWPTLQTFYPRTKYKGLLV